MRFDHFGPTGNDGIPAVAYQLADHLDAALAAAEDLAEAGQQWVPASAEAGYELAAEMAGERQVIERVRLFEAVLIGRVLKARKRAQALTREAGDFAGMTRLFVGGTAPLVDAVEELGDSTRKDFDTADGTIAYLRSRGVIDAEAADLPEGRMISLGDDAFLVAGRIALAPLTEMIIAFLDALEAHYDLYPDDEGEGDAADTPSGWADIVAAARMQGGDGASSTADTGENAAPAYGDGDAAADRAETHVVPVGADAGDGAGDADPAASHAAEAPAKTRSLMARLSEVAPLAE